MEERKTGVRKKGGMRKRKKINWEEGVKGKERNGKVKWGKRRGGKE